MTQPLRFALAQINPVVGDIAGNEALIARAYAQAAAQQADMVIFPELALIGYPAEDVVLMPGFVRRAEEAAQRLMESTRGGPAILFGGVRQIGESRYNMAWLAGDGKPLFRHAKNSLPNQGVFDEKRVYTHGDEPRAVTWRGITLGILICEEVWSHHDAQKLGAQGAQLLLVLNASPFECGKPARRLEVARKAAGGLPLIYVNLAGGQDDIIFDGGSFALGPSGEEVCRLPRFRSHLGWCVAQPEAGGVTLEPQPLEPALAEQPERWEAMKLGLADYVDKNGFPGVLLGLSGGIDSALSAACAVDALGPGRVQGVLLPSPYTSRESVEDALETARLLGIETVSVPISPGMAVMEEVLNPVFHESGWMENPLLGGNLQARLRGLTLMALSNRFGRMLLSTGNKSEIAVGYSTLYGDSCGGYNVLKDLYKTGVYELARWRNSVSRVIPPRSIDKPPSAELAPGQKDQDQLPPYDLLDAILGHHIEGQLDASEIVAKGFDLSTVTRVLNMVRLSEYKRRQSCPGVRLTPMMFGRDRRYPLTNRA